MRLNRFHSTLRVCFLGFFLFPWIAAPQPLPGGTICRPPTSGDSTIFGGLTAQTPNQSVLTNDANSLTVTRASYKPAVEILTGKVSGLSSEVDFPVESAAVADGVRAIAWGLTNAGLHPFGSIRLVRADAGAGLKIEVTPDFSNLNAHTYQLVLFHEGAVVDLFSGLSSTAGRFTWHPGVSPTVEWHANGTVIVKGFQPGFVAESSGTPIIADEALFRPENPQVRPLEVHSVLWTGEGLLDEFQLSDLRFDLQGREYQIDSGLAVLPQNSFLDVCDLDPQLPGSLDLEMTSAVDWSLPVDTSSSTVGVNGSLSIMTWPDLPQEGGQDSSPLTIRLTPISPVPAEEGNQSWLAEFDFSPLTGQNPTSYRATVYNQGLEVGSENLTGAQVAFAAGLVTAGATLSSALDGMDLEPLTASAAGLSLTLPNSQQIILGSSSFHGDQVVATTLDPSLLDSVQSMAGLRVENTGIDPLRVSTPNVQLKGEASISFPCGGRATHNFCNTGNRSEVGYRLTLKSPQNSPACFDVSVTPSTKLSQVIPDPPAPSQPFKWRRCLQPGTSCQVGYAGNYPGNTGVILGTTATITKNKQHYMMMSQHQMAGSPVETLPACPEPHSIDLCDDEEIFLSSFECGSLDEWSRFELMRSQR